MQITNKEFELIRNYIKLKYGINLTNEKKILVCSRLKGTLEKLKLKNFTEYYSYLLNDASGEESINFIDKMTTNHTYFMRETNHFDYLANHVLPYLEKTSKNNDIRIWSAGCSSGEEAYTLQMILRDYFKDKQEWNTDLLATDISTIALKKAQKAIYPKKKITNLKRRWKLNYLSDFDDENIIISEEIRSRVIYRRFNLMNRKFPFTKKFQVIFCRNVMIYFDEKTREELLKRFYDVSEDGAYLFIGNSETLNNIKTDYHYVMPSIYRKIEKFSL